MRLALIADVHSNLHALEVASDLVTEQSPDTVVCAGDVIGYGAFPNECCSEVERLCPLSVAGNHDRAVISGEVSRMNPYAAATTLWTSGRLGEQQRNFLSGLKTSVRFDLGGRSVAVFHGSPTDPDEYVHEDMVTERMLVETGCEVLALGHTHVPYVRRFGKGLVINPGSVGQPRDGDRRGSFAVIDTERLECETIRFEYPVQEAADAIVSAGLPHILAERLFIGR